MTKTKKNILYIVALVLTLTCMSIYGPKRLYKRIETLAMPFLSLGASFNIGHPSPYVPVDMKTSQVDGMVEVYVSAGTFIMGTNNKTFTSSYPEHVVYLDAYWIDQTEVTNSMYAMCVADGGCAPYVYVSKNYNPEYTNPLYADYPINYVKWYHADDYCKWAGRRLPTEAEWEKASRGIDGRSYPWGNETADYHFLNFNKNIGSLVPVDRYPLGASPYGALSMAGSLREWIADWFDPSYYRYSPDYDPQGPDEGYHKSLRGGSYLDDARSSLAFNRLHHNPKSAGINRGFRCAEDANP